MLFNRIIAIGCDITEKIRHPLKLLKTTNSLATITSSPTKRAKRDESTDSEVPKQTKRRRKRKNPENQEAIFIIIPNEKNELKLTIRKRRQRSPMNKHDIVNEHIESFHQNEDENQSPFAEHEMIAIANNDMTIIEHFCSHVDNVLSVGTLEDSAKAGNNTTKDKLNDKTEKASENEVM